MKKMIKKTKKGFTLVELVVVIAIVAILGAVSVIGYFAFIDKAKMSNDVNIVTQLNTVLKAEEVLEGKNTTMHDAVLDARENGFEVANLSPTKEGNDIVWSQVDDRFVLMNGEKTIFSENNKVYAKDYRLWKAYDEVPIEARTTNLTYSIYLKPTFLKNKYILPYVKVGIDQGEFYLEEKPVKMYFDGSADLIENVKPIIRGYKNNFFQSKSTKANYNVFGHIDEFKLYEAASESAHVYGDINKLTIDTGRLVMEKGSNVQNILVYGKKAIADINNGSKVTNLNMYNNLAIVNIESKTAEPNNIIFCTDKNITNSQFTIGGNPVSAENNFSKEPTFSTADQIYNSLDFAGGKGTVEEPFIIETEKHFASMDGINGYFKLNNDIQITRHSYGDGLATFVNISSRKGELVLDLNNHSISLSEKVKASEINKPVVFALLNVSGNVKFKGNGIIDASFDTKTCYGISINDADAIINIENGLFIGSPTAVQVQLGTLNITGGTFELDKNSSIVKPEDSKYIINCIDANFGAKTANVNITGGTFGFDPSAEPEGAGTTYVSTGHIVKNNNNGTYTVLATEQ